MMETLRELYRNIGQAIWALTTVALVKFTLKMSILGGEGDVQVISLLMGLRAADSVFEAKKFLSCSFADAYKLVRAKTW